MPTDIDVEPVSFGPDWDDPQPISFDGSGARPLPSVDEALELALHTLNTLPCGIVYAKGHRTSYDVAATLERVVAARRETITDEWSVDDVIEIAPMVSRDEALAVLKRVEANLDSERGINWDVIENAIGELRKAG